MGVRFGLERAVLRLFQKRSQRGREAWEGGYVWGKGAKTKGGGYRFGGGDGSGERRVQKEKFRVRKTAAAAEAL